MKKNKAGAFPLLLILLFLAGSINCAAQELAGFQEKIATAKRENDTLSLARAWYKLGRYYDIQQQTAKSNEALLIALQFAQAINNHKAVEVVANYLASNLSFMGENDSAIVLFNLALESCFAISDSVTLPMVLINLGNEYASVGNYVEAANLSIQALRVKEAMHDSTNIAYFYQKVGEVYKTAGETGKWEEYIRKAYRFIRNEKYANTAAVAAIYNDLGGLAKNRNEFQLALAYYDTVIAIGNQKGYTRGIGVALNNSATIHMLLGNYPKALEVATQGQQYNQTSEYQIIYNQNLLAEIYQTMGKGAEALLHARQAFNNPFVENYPEEKMRALRLLYELEKSGGNFEAALGWNELYKSVSDAIRDKEVRTRIMDLEISYQTEKKEQQIEMLTTENKLKNQQLQKGILLVTVLLLFILLILYILYIRRRQAEFKQNELQQQVLRTQMNPHFIFNVLGSIQNFLLNNNTKKASEYLSKFASLIRATLKYSATESISLSDELAMLANYMELEKMRSANRFSYRIEIADDTESDFIRIPPMMVQPFVENAIKHGFNNIQYEGQLELRVSDLGEWVEFTIEDNGKGISNQPEKRGEHQSMAMQIFEKRRKLIQQKLKRDFTFKMVNKKNLDPLQRGVRIAIKIPVFGE